MRIVMVANWWYRRGGLGQVMFAEAEGLHSAGHEVFGFAAAHDENEPTRTAMYFPPFVETADAGAGLGLGGRLREAVDLVYDREAARRFGALLDDYRPDIVHLHNTVRQLSPSILGQASKRDIPAVMTAHDFGLVCPQGLMLKGGTGLCTAPDCLGGNVLNAVRFRCVKGSRIVSSMAAVENLAHRALGLYAGRVASVIVPSRFLLETLVRGGVPRLRLRLLPNGVEPGPEPAPVPKGGPVLYVGRLAQGKGVDVLLAAAARLPEVSFRVVGDGPLGVESRASAPSNVTFVGRLDQEGVAAELAAAAVVAVPATWYENAPLVVMEAMRAGRPIVASRVGGLPELLGEAGLSVPLGDDAALASVIGGLLSHHQRAVALGVAARGRFLASFTFERHMAGLLAIYDEALAWTRAKSAAAR